jgi:hypothetical protein
MKIKRVRHAEQGGGFVVNGTHHVSPDPGANLNAIKRWMDAGNVPEPAMTLAERKTQKLAALKREVREHILGQETVYDQLNLIRRAVVAMVQHGSVTGQWDADILIRSEWIDRVLAESEAARKSVKTARNPERVRQKLPPPPPTLP